MPPVFGAEPNLPKTPNPWYDSWVMSVLELSDEQVISLVRQLSAESERTALLALAQEAQARLV
jgi:hypothetical protein